MSPMEAKQWDADDALDALAVIDEMNRAQKRAERRAR